MNILVFTVAALTLGVIFGKEYGRTAERAVVAKVLAEYHNSSAELQSFVSRILSSLDAEYSNIYDRAVADFEKVREIL